MLNHRIRGLLFHYKKNVILQLASIFLVRVFRNTLIPSVKMRLTMNKMRVLYVKPLNERLNILLQKKLLFWLLFFSIVNLFSIVKIRFIPRFVQSSHKCSFIRRYSPCSKPDKTRTLQCITALYFFVKYLRLSITFAGF